MTTHTTTACPPKDELRKLAHGRLSDDRQAELTEHVDLCPDCQARLEDAACDGDHHLTACVRNIHQAEPPKESAYWKALNKAEAELTGEYGALGMSAELKLDFLQPADTPGRLGKIGSFEVIKVIGRGGMGVVLHAFDPCLQRDVAIKMLDPQLQNNDVAWQRFCREARAAASVSHDNLVGVHQVDEDTTSGLPFLVMQLVNGETLEQRLKRVGKLTVAEAVRVGAQAASGLAAAHAIGLIHRDIKPGNILVEAGTDKVKLTDFGLARAVEDVKLTRTGFVAGTPLYMAPEQAKGDESDARADLFSLGIVLYETLAGKPPFDGKTPLAVLKRVADEKHQPLNREVPEVPDWLDDLIDRLLAKDPADRPQSAAEVADVLAAHATCPDDSQAAEPCVVRSATRVFGTRRRAKWTFAGFTAATFLLGAMAGGAGVWGYREMSPPATFEVTGVLPAAAPAGPNGPVGPDETASVDGRGGPVWSVAASEGAGLLVTGLEDGRIVFWDPASKRRLASTDDPAVRHTGPVWSIDLSRDGTMMLSASDDGAVKVWALTLANGGSKTLTYKLLVTRRMDMSVRAAALSADGKHLVTGDRGGRVRVFDICGDELEQTNEFPHGGGVTAVAFNKDGTEVASAGTDGTAAVWTLASGSKRITLTGHKGPVYGVSFSPNGQTIATGGWDGTVRLWDTDAGNEVGSIPAHEDGVWAVQFACCGSVLATGGQDGAVRVWNVDDRSKLREFVRHKGAVHAARFSPDGKVLLSGGRDGTAKMWKLKD